jgi:hypothetical protein
MWKDEASLHQPEHYRTFICTATYKLELGWVRHILLNTRTFRVRNCEQTGKPTLILESIALSTLTQA